MFFHKHKIWSKCRYDNVLPTSNYITKSTSRRLFEISRNIYNHTAHEFTTIFEVYSKFPKENQSEDTYSHPLTCPRKIPSKNPSNTSFTKINPYNPFPHNQPTPNIYPLQTILPLISPLIHLIHGIYQAKLVATQVTLYLSSRPYTTSGPSPRCSREYIHAQGLIIGS